MLGAGAGKPVLAPVRVDVAWLDAVRGEPVRALPARDDTEDGAAPGEAIVHRRAAHTARGLRLAEGPVHRVEEADDLRRALAQVGGVALARRGGDADGVEAGGHEEVP